MNKNKFAITPPMGWNSYDYYDTTVNEEQVKKNAQYMAMHQTVDKTLLVSTPEAFFLFSVQKVCT